MYTNQSITRIIVSLLAMGMVISFAVAAFAGDRIVLALIAGYNHDGGRGQSSSAPYRNTRLGGGHSLRLQLDAGCGGDVGVLVMMESLP